MTQPHYTLPREFGEKWVKALRSGEYKQGTCYLSAKYTDGITSEQRYCCLGVACSVSGIPDELLKREFIIPDFGMPIELVGDRGNNELVKILTTLNDGEKGITQKYTFSEIADWLESNVKFI
jgi:hypothetical protein